MNSIRVVLGSSATRLIIAAVAFAAALVGEWDAILGDLADLQFTGHHGVLLLDELGEFPVYLLDGLREPIEDGEVCIARKGIAVRFRARCRWSEPPTPARAATPAINVARVAARHRPSPDIGAGCRGRYPTASTYG